MPVKWYFCKPGARLLPFPTAFCSANWDSDLEWNPTLGEPHHWIPQKWSNGKAPLSAFGQRYCGTPEQFLSGIDHYCPTHVDGFGLPFCCSGIVPAGNIGFTSPTPPPLISSIVFSPAIATPPILITGSFVLNKHIRDQLGRVGLGGGKQPFLRGSIGLSLPKPPGLGLNRGNVQFVAITSIGLGKPTFPYPLGFFVLTGPPPSRLNLTAFIPATGSIRLGGDLPQVGEVVMARADLSSGELVIAGNLPQAGDVVFGSAEATQAANAPVVFTPFTPPVAPTNLIGFGGWLPQGGNIQLGILSGGNIGFNGALDCLSTCYTKEDATADWQIVSNQLKKVASGTAGTMFAPQLRQGTQTITFTMIAGGTAFLSQEFDFFTRTDCGFNAYCRAALGIVLAPASSGSVLLAISDSSGANTSTPLMPGVNDGDTIEFTIVDDGVSISTSCFNVTTSTLLASLTLSTSVWIGMIMRFQAGFWPVTAIVGLQITDSSGTTWNDDFNGPNGVLANHRPLSGCT